MSSDVSVVAPPNLQYVLATTFRILANCYNYSNAHLAKWPHSIVGRRRDRTCPSSLLHMHLHGSTYLKELFEF